MQKNKKDTQHINQSMKNCVVKYVYFAFCPSLGIWVYAKDNVIPHVHVNGSTLTLGTMSSIINQYDKVFCVKNINYEYVSQSLALIFFNKSATESMEDNCRYVLTTSFTKTSI